MKQRLTKKQESERLGKENSYAKLHETELRVQRLERIVEELLFWREGTPPYEEAKDEYVNDYVESEEMNSQQKLSPKYWVVHDKKSDDVYIDTARKGKWCSVHAFLDNHSFDRWTSYLEIYDTLDLFLNDEDLEVILIEINIVEVK